MRFKRFITLVAVFIVTVLPVFSSDIETPIFKISIENDNLFVCLSIEPPLDVESITLRLKGGKKIKILPVVGRDCRTVFYLDSSQAQLVKKKGIKSIIYYGVSTSQRVDIDPDQNRLFVSHLP